MAEAMLLTVVRGVAGKAADELLKSVTRMWRVDDDRHKLERHLVYVQSLLVDAEAKSETNDAVKTWMKELKAAAYRADDVLDDFQYEALRREALNGRSTASKVLSNFTSKNRLVFRNKASKDLKNVLEKIDVLVTEMKKFDLVVRAEATLQVLPPKTHSALDDKLDILGRDDDKELVLKLLLEQQDRQDVQVLPIIGMGGVGKTTLAKVVYNNPRIQKHFELKMWHCVSENFEAISVVRSVIELATNKTCDLPDTIELLRQKLQEEIGRKRFLLILDDVWNENPNKWEDNLKPLLCSSIGGSGSMIVVTSRSQQVASIMGTLPSHKLRCLSEDDSWELFSKKAFSKGVKEQAELVVIGRRISSKCKGLPLALKTMGGLMSSKQKVQEWEAIADCNIGDTSRGKDEVLPILKLSYKHLSSEMKQCFAFCAVFPKDYEMEKDMLIQLWIANGYIHEEGTMDLAQKGEFVFSELAWRSFLQDVVSVRSDHAGYVNSSRQEQNCCKMHDLMHDLAKDVAKECSTAEELIQRKISINDVYHLQISEDHELEKISQLFRGTIYLRTLLMLSSSDKYLMKLKPVSSRALCFHCRDTSIVYRQLTYTAHLRYLDLSNSGIVSLPNSICVLYNLQSLRLNECSRLQYLPEGMSTMRKLSHIYLLGCHSLERMPPKLSLLHNLRTLTTFVVDTKDGCGIEELEGLQQLGNRLELYNLKKVKCGSMANLHEKQNLNELLLYWGRTYWKPGNNPTIDEANNQEQVLESLSPHAELKTLEIHGYGGLKISQWMRNAQMFQCLRELIMTTCPRCKDLPMVWLSSSLEHLSLSCMESLTTLCEDIDMEAEACHTSLQIFPKLKRMELIQLPELEINSSVIFPQLEKVEISNCDKLTRLPEVPVLKDLELRCFSEDVSLSMCMPLGCLSSVVRLEIAGLLVDVVMHPDGQQGQSQRPLDTLRYLRLVGDDSFISLFNKSKLELGLLECFALVEELNITACSNIVHWPVEELRCFPRLRTLRIWNCFELEGKGSSSEEEEILPLPQLEILHIDVCNRLLHIPKLPASLVEIVIDFSRSTNLATLPSNLGDLDKLRKLRVWHCPALKALPDGMDGLISLEQLTICECPAIEKFPQGLLQRLPALKRLVILGCPDLQRRCGEGGEYFDLVASIPDKDIEAAPRISKPIMTRFLPSCGGGSHRGN